jgi:hypothetical protein
VERVGDKLNMLVTKNRMEAEKRQILLIAAGVAPSSRQSHNEKKDRIEFLRFILTISQDLKIMGRITHDQLEDQIFRRIEIRLLYPILRILERR